MRSWSPEFDTLNIFSAFWDYCRFHHVVTEYRHKLVPDAVEKIVDKHRPDPKTALTAHSASLPHGKLLERCNSNIPAPASPGIWQSAIVMASGGVSRHLSRFSHRLGKTRLYSVERLGRWQTADLRNRNLADPPEDQHETTDLKGA